MNPKTSRMMRAPKVSKIYRMFKMYKKMAPDLVAQLCNSWRLFQLLIIADFFLTLFVIRTVKYTEIDWSTYMVQVGQIFNSSNLNFNYAEIEGPTGPLVYPAGHTYIYFLLKGLTDGGSDIRAAQTIFLFIYIAQLVFVYLVYSNKRVKQVPPYIFFLICFTSYRIHSIYVLRLFNDTIAVLIAYASFYALLRRCYSTSAFLFSLGISVKMNILLYAPAYALVFYEEIGLKKSIKNALIAVSTQLVLATPFILANPQGYLERAFDFGRVFLHKWTVNWRFLDEQVFTSPTFFRILLLGHMLILLTIFWSRWLKCLIGNKFSLKVKKDDPILTLFIANFIGVAFSRSLHYQFYVWYYHSLPMLLWATRFSTVQKVLIFGCIEFAWNQYPSTAFSSLLLHVSHLNILVGLLTRNWKIFAVKEKESGSVQKSAKNKNQKRKIASS